MILDELLKLAAGQQVTVDAVSTSSYDAGNVTPKRNIAEGTALAIVVVITAIGTNTGSVKFEAIQSAAAALTSPKILGEVDAETADIAVGATFIIPIGRGIPSLRYFGLNNNITGTVDYTYSAWIVPRNAAVGLAQFYARAYTVDLS